MLTIATDLCRSCGKLKRPADMVKVSAFIAICFECLANPAMDKPVVNQSGDNHHCSNCLSPFPTEISHADNTVVERVDEIHEGGKRYEVCKRCADEWEARNLQLIVGTPYYMEKYA